MSYRGWFVTAVIQFSVDADEATRQDAYALAKKTLDQFTMPLNHGTFIISHLEGPYRD